MKIEVLITEGFMGEPCRKYRKPRYSHFQESRINLDRSDFNVKFRCDTGYRQYFEWDASKDED